MDACMLYYVAKEIWTLISRYTNEDCKGCDLNSFEYKHECLVIWSDFHLIYMRYAWILFDRYYNRAFMELDFDEIHRKFSLRNGQKLIASRYKKDILKEDIFTQILASLHETTVNNCFYDLKQLCYHPNL